MAIQVSPGVAISERDLTNVVPAVATTPAGYAGSFVWGPVLERRLISSQNDLVNVFGKPDDNTYEHFFTAWNFLSYGTSLTVVRNVGTSATNASSSPTVTLNGDGTTDDFTLTFTPVSEASITVTVGGVVQTPTTHYTVTGTTLSFTTAPTTGTGNIVVKEKQLIKNETDFDGLSSLPGNVYAKYPGILGNSLKVILADATSFSTLTSGEQDLFTSVPEGTEIHFAVIDEDGEFTGVAGTILEKKEYLTKTVGDTFDNGEARYYKTWINQSSKYIWATGSLTQLTSGKVSLINAVDDNVLTDGEHQAGFALFINDDVVDVSLILGGPSSSATAAYIIDNVVGVRLDCVAFLSPDKASVVNNVGQETTDIATFRTAMGTSSYAVLDSGWKLQTDIYNDVTRWVPLSGDIAGLCARTDNIADPWFSPAGYNRGQIKNVIKLAWNPTKAERDELYKIQVNPVITQQGIGTILFGDKTLLTRPSAFDRINVRRLFIVLEKSIATASKFFLFEFNDEFTRAQFRNLVEPFLREVQGRRGVYDFKVVCDENNNTAEVINQNQFVGDIYIKPARSINFIQLNFIATREGVSFEEVGA